MYRAFGLNIDSDLPLPELAESTEGKPDVTISLHAAPAPHTRDTADYWFAPDEDPFVYRVSQGNRIDIWAPEGAVREDVSVWLLGTVMAALLHQRGWLTVHANCLETPAGQVIGIAGESGDGKSSLAAQASACGWQVLGDDLLAIDQGGEVYPGVLRLKLWRNDVQRLGLDAGDLSKVASDLDKYHVPLQPVASGPRKLSRLYVLSTGSIQFERLEGAKAAHALLANLYRFDVGQEVRGEGSDQFIQALALASSIDIWRFSRPRDQSSIGNHFAALARHQQR